MAIMDKLSALLPWRGERDERREMPAPQRELGTLREDLDRWMQRVLDEPVGRSTSAGPGWIPSADVHETDDEVIVTVEVPGLERDDLDLLITPTSLIVRGEKREVREGPARGVTVTPEGLILRVDPRSESARPGQDERWDAYVAECQYGSFVRTVPLPPGLEVDRAEAQLKHGVLLVRFPKAASRPGSRHVPIQRG